MAEDKEALGEIDSMHGQAMQAADEKLQVAQEQYEILDKHIQRLGACVVTACCS